MYVNIYIYMHICIFIYLCVYIFIYVYINLNIQIYTGVCVCVHINICTYNICGQITPVHHPETRSFWNSCPILTIIPNDVAARLLIHNIKININV